MTKLEVYHRSKFRIYFTENLVTAYCLNLKDNMAKNLQGDAIKQQFADDAQQAFEALTKV